MMDPRATQVDRRPREVDGVQPAADAVARFQHHMGDAGPAQRRRGGQARDTGADDDHPVDRADDFSHRLILRYAAAVGALLPGKVQHSGHGPISNACRSPMRGRCH